MKRRFTMVAGASILAGMLGVAPGFAEEKQQQTAEKPTPIVELLRLLEAKKVISREESEELEKKFSPTALEKAAAEAKQDQPTAVVEKPAPLPAAQFSVKDVNEAALTMKEQGIVSESEAREMQLRIEEARQHGQGETVPNRSRVAVGKEEFPYRRTLLTVAEIREQLRFLAFQHILSRQEASDVFERFGKKYDTDKVVDVVLEQVNEKMEKMVDSKTRTVEDLERYVALMPSWLERYKVSGDMRLRYQADYFAKDNVFPLYRIDDPTKLMNTTSDRQRYRLRARLNVTAEVNENLEANFGIATGTTGDPLSTNVTMGDGMNKKSIALDLAYLRWAPTPLAGIPKLVIQGGRFPNPLFSTELVWDRELRFDGAAMTYTPDITPSFSMFTTIGAFPLQEVESSQHDKYLLAGQIGAEYRSDANFYGKLGVSYYHYLNTQGHPNGTFANYNDKVYDYTAPTSVQKGNTYFNINDGIVDPGGGTITPKFALAPEYHLVNLTGVFDLGYWHPVHATLVADYVVNIGYKEADVNRLTGATVAKENTGYLIGLTVGSSSILQFGDWKAFLNYRKLGADAVMDAFTDSTFHLGGTNAKGWTIGGEYGLGYNVWLSGKWSTANEVSSQIINGVNVEKLDIDVLQIDLNARF